MRLVTNRLCRKRYKAQVKVKRWFWKRIANFIKKPVKERAPLERTGRY